MVFVPYVGTYFTVQVLLLLRDVVVYLDTYGYKAKELVIVPKDM